jgi:hypothetical protein
MGFMAGKDETTVWVLDTETKGTGAEMVPLEKLQRRKRSNSPAARTTVLRRDLPAREADPVEPAAAPRRFKVVSVMSGALLADDVEAAKMVDAMRSVQSVLDVRIYVWEPADGDWRPLTLGEKKAVWAFRDREV